MAVVAVIVVTVTVAAVAATPAAAAPDATSPVVPKSPSAVVWFVSLKIVGAMLGAAVSSKLTSASEVVSVVGETVLAVRVGMAPGAEVPFGSSTTVGDIVKVGPRVAVGDIVSVGEIVKAGERVTVGETVSAGDSVAVGENVSARSSVTVGDSVLVGETVSVGEIVKAGDSVSVGEKVSAGESVTVGNNVSVGEMVSSRESVTAGKSVTVGKMVAGEGADPAGGGDGVAVGKVVSAGEKAGVVLVVGGRGAGGMFHRGRPCWRGKSVVADEGITVGGTIATASGWMAMLPTVVGSGVPAETVNENRAGEQGEIEMGIRIWGGSFSDTTWPVSGREGTDYRSST